MSNSSFSRKNSGSKIGLKCYLFQLAVVLLLAGYQLGWGQWQIETNILSLLPTESQAQASQKYNMQQAKSALFQQANQRVLVAISGEQAITAYKELEKTIAVFDGIENEAMTLPDINEVIAFYQPYRDSVITDSYQALLSAPSTTSTVPQAINNFVLGKLTQVSDPFVSGSLAISPRLNLAGFLATGLTQLQSFETEQGILFVNENNLKHYIMPIKVDVDGFSVKQTQAFSHQLQTEFKQLESKFGVNVLYSGVLFHTAESSQQAEFEMSTFGVISLLAVLVMILMVFRSAKPVNLALVVLAISVVYGLTAVVTLFNQLHLLTLVFAVTLIGIVIDYCFHAFVSLSTTSNNEGGIKSIRTALCLGFITTALGYAALIMSPLSLLSQVAVFMIFGLFGALLTVLFLLPHFNLTGKISVTPSVWSLTDKLNAALTRLHKQRRIIFALLSLGLVTATIVDDVNFNDDIRLLNSSPAFLIDNEIEMAKLMGYQNSQRIVITADSSEILLQRQEVLLSRLDKVAQLQQQSDLTVKSIASLLPSVAKQQANHRLLKTAEQQQAFELGLATLGLTDNVDEFKPLTLEMFNKGPLQSLSEIYIYQYQNLYQGQSQSIAGDYELSTKYALWVETSGAVLSDELQQWISEQGDMSIDNKPAEVTAALSHYRQALFLLFAGAIIVVTIVLCLRFGLGQGLLGLLSIVVSAGGALLLTQLALGHLNIFNLLAVLLILALAIDYVIFYQEHGLQRNTVLAITLSAISSALVFGVLALSVTPAVESFGLTVMFGILLVFLLAPLSAKTLASLSEKRIAPLNTVKLEVEK